MAIDLTKLASYYSTLSICANVVLLIVTVRLLLRGPLSTAGKPRLQKIVRGHKYVTIKQRCTNNRRINFFSNRIVNLWNNLLY